MIEKLCEIIPRDRIERNVPMSSLTTFRTGGNADVIIYPHNVEELKNVESLTPPQNR